MTDNCNLAPHALLIILLQSEEFGKGSLSLWVKGRRYADTWWKNAGTLDDGEGLAFHHPIICLEANFSKANYFLENLKLLLSLKS